MAAFTVVAAALALQVDRKWLENLLSHHQVPGTSPDRQGVRRRLTPQVLLPIAVAILLIRQLGMPIAKALALASRICESPEAECAPASGLVVRVDVVSIERSLGRRLREAAEIAVPARRGRPPTRRHLPETT